MELKKGAWYSKRFAAEEIEEILMEEDLMKNL
jgi:hypothetical protein